MMFEEFMDLVIQFLVIFVILPFAVYRAAVFVGWL